MSDIAEGRLNPVVSRIEAKEAPRPRMSRFFAKELMPRRRPVFRPAPVKPGWSHGACWGEPDGLYSDPVDCTRYIHCFNGYTYRRMCPFGTAWNPETARCDFPYNVPFLCNVVDAHVEDFNAWENGIIDNDIIDVYASKVANEIPKQVLHYVEKEVMDGEDQIHQEVTPQRNSKKDIDRVDHSRPLNDFVYGIPPPKVVDLDVVTYFDDEEDQEVQYDHPQLERGFFGDDFPEKTHPDQISYRVGVNEIVHNDLEFRDKFGKMGNAVSDAGEKGEEKSVQNSLQFDELLEDYKGSAHNLPLKDLTTA